MPMTIPEIVVDESESVFSEDGKPEPSRLNPTALIIQLPIEQLRRIAQTEGITSLARETEHFSDTTTLHGVLRVYQGKSFVRLFWLVVIFAAVILFLIQFVELVKILASKPTVSKVSFILPEDGMDFPGVTICNYNPIRRSYVQALNRTGQFSETLLDYLVQSYVPIQALYENAIPQKLLAGYRDFLNYTQHVDQNFTINGFFTAAGFKCEEMLKICSFGGRDFDCCSHAVPVLTDMGLCYQFRMTHATDDWIRRQKQAGVIYGLQVIADYHSEEQIGTNFATNDPAPLFINDFEDGFRFYVHPLEAISYLSTEGISVSPNTRVYAAVNPSRFLLLPEDQWGNCTTDWASYHTNLPYSSTNCKALCRAKFFAKKCGCSPFAYNIDNKLRVCSPYEIYQCIKKYSLLLTKDEESPLQMQLPSCAECKVECDSWVYHTYNSYGTGFSEGALRWFANQNNNWTSGHVRANFVVMNIFFRDMTYTEYSQIQATGITETLSDIGGNMGLFLGASLISAIEIFIYLTKISWIGISKKRRGYLSQKKHKEVEKERRLTEAIESHMLPSPKTSTSQRIRKFGTSLVESFNRKNNRPIIRRKTTNDRASQKMSTDTLDDFYVSDSQSNGTPKISVISVQSDYSRTRGRRRSEVPTSNDLIQLRIDLDSAQPRRARSMSDPESGTDTPSSSELNIQSRQLRIPALRGPLLTVPEEAHGNTDRVNGDANSAGDDNRQEYRKGRLLVPRQFSTVPEEPHRDSD